MKEINEKITKEQIIDIFTETTPCINPKLPSENNPNHELLTFPQVFKKMSKLSLPMALSYTFSFEVFLVAFLLNYLSKTTDDRAATTVITVMMNTLIILGISPLFGMSILASNKIGDLNEARKNKMDEDILTKKRADIAAINRSGLLTSAVVSPAIIASMVFSKSLLTNVFNQHAEVAEIAQRFLRPYALAVPALVSRVSSEQMMFSFGKTTPAMLIGLASLSVGTGISAWLGLGGLGIPKQGAPGIAFGFVAEAYLTALCYALYIARHKDFHQFPFFSLLNNIKACFSELRDLLKIGGSIAFAVANEMAISLAMGILSGIVGTTEQSAMAFAMELVFFTFIPLAAFGQAASQEVSRQVGAKHYEDASRIGKYGLLTALIYMAPIPLMLAIKPDLFIFGVAKDKQLIQSILKTLMPIISAGIITDTARYNILQQLRAIGDLNGSTITSAAGLSSGIVIGGALGVSKKNINAIAAGYTGGIFLAWLGLLIRWSTRIQANKIQQVNERTARYDTVSICNSCLFSRRKKNNGMLKIEHQAATKSLVASRMD